MARKQQKKYTVPELVEFKKRLESHQINLAKSCGRLADAFRKEPEFDTACLLRDAAQLLTTTALCLSHMGTLISLANNSGEPQTIPYGDECGLPD